jgi:integrase/recombinase XerD
MAQAQHITQLNRLEEEVADDAVSEQDYELIDEYINWIYGQKADTTVGNHSFYLRKMANRMPVPLADAELEDLNDTLDALKGGTHPDVKDEGIGVGNYQATLRVFYRYHDHLGVEPEKIEIERSGGRDLGPEDLLYQEDVDDLLHACFENSRDRAFIALALATGQRLDALRTLRLRHIERGPNGTMSITLNEEEGALKGASGAKPLLWSKQYVREWVDNHPYSGDGDAAVFCALDNSVLKREDVEPAEPMDDSAFRRILTTRAEKAGIQKNVYPHLLRHCAITRMVLEGLSEQQIKNIVGWAPDSSEFATYVTLADELSNDSVRRQLGYPDSGAEVIVGRPTLEDCPNCGDRMPEGAERCLTCQTPITHAAAEEGPVEGAAEETIREGYREAGDMGTVEKIQMLDDLLEDPDVRAMLQQKLEE